MLSIVRLSARYQLTLPQDVRQAIDCEQNDRLAFRTDASGRVYIENLKTIDVHTVRGLLRRSSPGVSATSEQGHSVQSVDVISQETEEPGND